MTHSQLTVSFQVMVDGPTGRKLARLAYDAEQSPGPTAELLARAALVLMLDAAKTKTLSLVPPQSISQELIDSHQPAPLREWSLDTSGFVNVGFDDGTSIDVPPQSAGSAA